MKILHLCNKTPFPGRDGSSIAMESLIRLEALANHDIHVIALNTNKHWVKDPKSSNPSVKLEVYNLNLSPGFFDFIKHCFNPRSYFASRFFQLNAAQAIQIASKDADLIVVDGIFMSVYKQDWGETPYVIRAHNIEHQIWERTLLNSKTSLKKLFITWQTRKLKLWETHLLQESNIWAITDEDSENMKYLGGKKVSVFPCTFDASESWLFSSSKSSKIYHLGALDWEPNIVGMKWFLKNVLKKIEGKVDITVYSKIWPSKLKLPKGVTWKNTSTGDIPFDDYGVFIAPLLSGSGMRIKLLEAMSRGKAIITTSIGAEGLRVTSGKHLFIADEANDFAKAIYLLCNNSEVRLNTGKAARNHALENFTDELYINKMKNIKT
ncbi:MAG: Uncharacterised protein [Owenweeksia sp. TMED14]|nr:MAG: Uncharacterised protein [Owenweeksia sp. TMED14]